MGLLNKNRAAMIHTHAQADTRVPAHPHTHTPSKHIHMPAHTLSSTDACVTTDVPEAVPGAHQVGPHGKWEVFGRVALKTSQQLQTDSAWLRERAPHKDRASLCSLMATLTAGQTFLPPSHPSLPPAVTSLSTLQPLALGCPNSEGPKTSRCGSAMFLQAQLNLGMTGLPKEASAPPSPFLISKASP